MALCAAAPLWLPGPAVAAVVVPPGFENRQLAVLDIPTGLAFTPDGRLLITTKNGGLRVYEDEVLRATPAIDLGSRLCTNAEQGRAILKDLESDRLVSKPTMIDAARAAVELSESSAR